MAQAQRKPTEARSQARTILLRLAEIAAFFGVLTLTGYLVTGSPDFSTLTVHPFWLPVLAMTAHYGSRWGALSAITASVIALLAQGENVVPGGLGGAELALPAAWLASAVGVGAYRDRDVARLREAEKVRRSMEEDCARLEAYARKARLHNQMLVEGIAQGAKADAVAEPA